MFILYKKKYTDKLAIRWWPRIAVGVEYNTTFIQMRKREGKNTVMEKKQWHFETPIQ